MTPTETGLLLANRANAAVETWDRNFFEPLGAGRAAFTSQLRSLLRAVRVADAGTGPPRRD